MERIKQSHIRGFTLIEVIITIAVVGVFVAMAALMFQNNVKSLFYSDDLIKALGLARLELSKVNNLSYGDSTLADGYNNTTSNYESTEYDLNRAVNIVAGTGNDLKKVEVTVYPTGTTDQLIKLAAYVADISFGPGSGGGGGGGNEADSLVVTGGTIKKKKLKNVTMQNTGSSTIVWTAVKVTFTGSGGIKLKKIKKNKTTLWSGTASSGSTTTLTTSLSMSAGTSYNNVKFIFSKNVSTVTVDYFEFQDASQSASYSWP